MHTRSLFILVFLSITILISCGDQLNLSQKRLIFKTKHYISCIKELQDEGILSDKMAQQKISNLQSELKKQVSDVTSLDKFQETEEFFNLLVEQTTGSVMSKVSGFFTFVNIIWFIATVIIVLSLGALFSIYVIPVLVSIPAAILEMIVWGTCFALIVAGKAFHPSIGPFIALPGCLGLIGAYYFTLVRIDASGTKETVIQLCCALCTIVWGITAIWYDSSMIGFMTIISLETLLGFMFVTTPFCYVIGFREDAAMARATGASFILLASFIGTKLLNITIPMLRPFETGIHFVATFVYFLGLLIVSNRYYHREVKIQNYILSNIGALGSGVIALFLGSVFDELGYLQGVGGTFFMLMLLDKYSEIPWERETAAWGLLGLGGILYGIALFIRTHPQYFIFRF